MNVDFMDMELLSDTELKIIASNSGIQASNIVKWCIAQYSDEMKGYLGEHLKLIAQVNNNGVVSEKIFFLKCIPRHDEFKAQYLKETRFFKKEFMVLNSLFRKFQENEGNKKWRPKLFYAKEGLFVFEDVTEDGYVMPSQYNFLNYNELIATITSVARFHAQSYILEEKKSKESKRSYRIWEDYSDYLTEPEHGRAWRDTGMKAVVDTLKVFSKFRHEPKFLTLIEKNIPELYQSALNLMKPSCKCRNVVIHRDLWTNNILFKRLGKETHALLVDFQTIIYASPMLDVSSVIYFNTNSEFRNTSTLVILKHYYDVLSNELKTEDIDPEFIIEETKLPKLYEESVLFGLTQAALIVPIIALTEEKRQETFENPEMSAKVNLISRSEEVIELAKENESYRERILELFDEIVEKYILPSKPQDSL